MVVFKTSCIISVSVSRKAQFISELYAECPGRNVPDFGRMFLKLK